MNPGTPQETHRLAPMRGLHINRIESLTDGVFAIAMTILIFDLKSSATGHGDSGALLTYLTAITGNFIIYIISFFLLALFWFYYHKQLHRIVRPDDGLVWLNICSARKSHLLREHHRRRIVPAAALAACGPQRMLDPRVTPELRVGTTARSLVVLGCYVLAFAIALVNSYYFFVAFWAIPIALMVTSRLVRRRFAA